VKQIWLATMGLIKMLDGVYLPGGEQSDRIAHPDDETLDRWHRRYLTAVRRLAEAGIDTTDDQDAGFREYVNLRVRWQRYIEVLASHMAHELAEIDPEGCNPPVYAA